jgi:DNA polymerase III subunit delta'
VKAPVAAADQGDLWDQVVGQDTAVARLRASVQTPVHAYLLVGPEGSGTRAAARAFAADLLTAGLDTEELERGRRLVASEVHPALTVVERDGASIDAVQARDVVRLAGLAPAEGELQVIVLVDFHLVREAAPILLKSIEEPPASTVFLVLAEELPPELATIASRCVRIDFDAVAEDTIRDRLVAEGADADAARAAAAGAGGSMDRARLLVRDPGASERRAAWYGVPDRLDGTGAQASQLVDELLAAADEVAVPLTERQDAELAEFEERAEAAGGGRVGDRKRLEARHRREQRRVRTDELRAGLAALVARYRDDVAAGGSAADFLAAADAVQDLCDGLVFNPREQLQLQALFVALPRLASD